MRRLMLMAAAAASMALAVPGTALAATSGGGPTPGAASTSFAAEATSFQNATVSQAMTRAPGGVRTGPNQVEWHNYAVVMTVPSTSGGSTLAPNATDSCPAPIIGTRWTCVYDESYFNGTRLQFSDAGYYQDLWYYGGSDWETHSWSNTRGQRSWLNEYESHTDSGYSLCMTGNAHAGVYDGLAASDRWIYLSSNYAAC
jgi:hypothetical protein